VFRPLLLCGWPASGLVLPPGRIYGKAVPGPGRSRPGVWYLERSQSGEKHFAAGYSFFDWHFPGSYDKKETG